MSGRERVTYLEVVRMTESQCCIWLRNPRIINDSHDMFTDDFKFFFGTFVAWRDRGAHWTPLNGIISERALLILELEAVDYGPAVFGNDCIILSFKKGEEGLVEITDKITEIVSGPKPLEIRGRYDWDQQIDGMIDIACQIFHADGMIGHFVLALADEWAKTGRAQDCFIYRARIFQALKWASR